MKKTSLNFSLMLIALTLSMGAANAQEKIEKLKTKNSNEVGLTISSYSYKEPEPNVKNVATNFGIEYFGSRSFSNDWFGLVGADYNDGKNDYSSPGSGVLNSIPTHYFNLKVGVGRDFAFDKFVLSPYVGYGYRQLKQNMAGMRSSTGDVGYDRRSEYKYIPVGIINRFELDSKVLLVSTLEYDHLIEGKQFSGLSITNSPPAVTGVPDANNTQKTGYGMNLSVMYQKDALSIGPYYKYWEIKDSDTVSARIRINGFPFTATSREPANRTAEYGIKVTFRF